MDLRELNGRRFLGSGEASDQILALLMRLKNRREAIRLEHQFKRLPKWVADKLATATPSQIEEWQERLLRERSLSDIFDRV